MTTGDRESIGDDLGVWSVDDENQLTSEDTLDGDGDPLDRGYSAADRLQGSIAHGVTAWEQANDETIDQRIRQEVPDPYSAYGAPDNESGMDTADGAACVLVAAGEGAGLDEAPFAYKDIHTVMAAQQDLVEVLAKFTPKIVRMADDGSRED